MPRAMLSLRELVERFGAENTFIISKAGPRMAKRSKHWLLNVMAIAEVTGFDSNNIYFLCQDCWLARQGQNRQTPGHYSYDR